MRISDWSSDVCSSDLLRIDDHLALRRHQVALQAEARHFGEEFGTIAARNARLETGLFEIGGAVHDPARQARHGDQRGAAFANAALGKGADRKSVVSGKSV